MHGPYVQKYLNILNTRQQVPHTLQPHTGTSYTIPTHRYLVHYTYTQVPRTLHPHTGTSYTTPTHRYLIHYTHTQVPHTLHLHTGTSYTTPTHRYLIHYTHTQVPHTLHPHTGTSYTTPTHRYLIHYTYTQVPHTLHLHTGTSYTTLTHTGTSYTTLTHRYLIHYTHKPLVTGGGVGWGVDTHRTNIPYIYGGPFYLCLTVRRAHGMRLCLASVSQLSLNLLHRFLSNFSCWLPCAILKMGDCLKMHFLILYTTLFHYH